MNFEELFAQYPCPFTDEQVKAQVADIEAKHFAENNNIEVWKECLHQIDYTTLSADDTIAKVESMANAVNTFEAKFPGVPNVAAICVYPAMAEYVRKALKDPKFNIACCCAGFPAAQTFPEIKVAETAMALKMGATEVDIVLSVGKFLEGRYQECFDEIREIKDVCKEHHLKVILETGLLKTAENIWKASILSMAAGCDLGYLHHVPRHQGMERESRYQDGLQTRRWCFDNRRGCTALHARQGDPWRRMAQQRVVPFRCFPSGQQPPFLYRRQRNKTFLKRN